MKNQNIILPLALVVAALVVGTATIGIGLSGSKAPTIATDTSDNAAELTIISVTADQSASAAQTGARVVSWSSNNYPSDGKVTINLIKLISSNPDSYEFVRALATDTANDGRESWTPTSDESGSEYYVEVVCSLATVSQSCHSTAAPVQAF